MSKTPTKEECKALINKIKSARETLRDIEYKEEFDQLPEHIQMWINGEIMFKSLEKFEKRVVVELLLNKQKNQKNEYLMLDILKNTGYSKYVEISEKYRKIMGGSPNKDVEFGILLMDMYGEDTNLDYVINLDAIAKMKDGKKVTLKSELSDITKRCKKSTAREAKMASKLKNISKLNLSIMLSHLMDRLSPDLRREFESTNMNFGNNIQEFVYEHQFEIMEALKQEEQLEFCRGQQAGKIR